MPNPTFDGMALTTDAAREDIGAPQARVYTQTIPDVAGEFAQVSRQGGRDITATGIYKGLPAAFPTDAQADLKDSIRALQERVADGVGPYVGIDGHTYSTCVLKSYAPAGEMTYIRSGGNYVALVRIRAVIRDLNP